MKPKIVVQGHNVAVRLKSWNDISTAVKKIWASCKQVIVERFIAGEDIHLFVIQGKMVAAARRIPANVIDDGFSSIKGLIEKRTGIRNAAVTNSNV